MVNSYKPHWTPTAIECYERGGICYDCPTKELITSQRCQMKTSVMELVRTIGKPPEPDEMFPDFSGLALKILKALYDGAETLEEVSRITGHGRNNCLTCANNDIFPYFENRGFERPSKNAFPAFVEFFKKLHEKKSEFEQKNVRKNEKIIEEKIMFDEDLKLKYANYLKPLVDAVKQGYESYDDLVRETTMTKHQISVYWKHLLTPWIKSGLISQISEKTQKQEVIDFIRNRLIDVQNGNVSASEFEENENRHSEPVPAPKQLKGKIEIKKRTSEAAASQKERKLPEEDKEFMTNQPLTEMENVILELLLQGSNYQQIADKIPLSIATVKTHVNHIFNKRGYNSLQDLLVAEFGKKLKDRPSDTNKSNLLETELNQTKLLLEGKNNQYNAALDDTIRLQRENEQLQKRLKELEELKARPQVIYRYDELMLVDDIQKVIYSDDSDNKLKIMSIKNYFNVYERFLDKKEKEVLNAGQI